MSLITPKLNFLQTSDKQYHLDFGKLRQKTPSYIIQVRSEDELCHAMAFARDNNLTVTMRGAGHSVNGQSLNRDGILLVNYEPAAQLNWLDDTWVEVSGRSSWRGIEQALNAVGRQSPVLTDYLDTSIGGTLSVGGIGLNSIIDGFQVDNIRRIRLIKPDGEAVWCSATEHQELFRFGMASLGQIGIVEKVEMRTLPYRPFTHVLKRNHATMKEQWEFFPQLLTEGVDHFNGYVRGDQIVSEYGYFSDMENNFSLSVHLLDSPEVFEKVVETEYPFRMQERRDIWLNTFNDHFRLWTDYIFSYKNAGLFVDYLSKVLCETPLKEAVKGVYILIIKRPPAPTAFGLLPAPEGEYLFGYGMYTMINRWNPALLGKTKQQLREVMEMCIRYQGRPYLYGAYDLDVEKKQMLYGNDYRRLLELRNELNAHYLNPESF